MLISLLSLAACGDATTLAPLAPQSPDTTAPSLDIRAPLRGAVLLADATSVEVRGFVHDDTARSVLVNGVRARVGGDGSFTVKIDVRPGLNLVQTLVLDAAHHLARDTRVIIGGPLLDAAVPAEAGVVARLDARAVRAGGADVARRLDLATALLRQNPLAQSAVPCFGARTDLARLAHAAPRVDVTPVHGGLLVDAEIPDLDLALRVTFATSCSSARTEEVPARATRFRLQGVVHLAARDGAVVADVADASAWIDGLSVDGALLPGRVADGLEATLPGTLTGLIQEAVAAELPGAVLRGLGGSTRVVAGGHELELRLRASELALDDTGASVVAASEARAAGGGFYLAGAASRPSLAGRGGVAVGIAAGALNQLLAAAWGAGVFERNVASPASPGYDAAALSLRLPPQLVARDDGKLHLMLPEIEAEISARAAGPLPHTVARLAMTVDVVVEPRVVDGRLALIPAAPALYVDRLDGGDAEPALRGAPDLVAADLVRAVSELTAAIPLPAATQAMSLLPGDAVAGGYLLVSGEPTP